MDLFPCSKNINSNKKCDRSNFSSYRPIALLSCISKAYETILNKWFLKHLSSFNLLSDRQYGLVWSALLAVLVLTPGNPLLAI